MKGEETESVTETVETEVVTSTPFYLLTDFQYCVHSSACQETEGGRDETAYTMLITTGGSGKLTMNDCGFTLKRGKCMLLMPTDTAQIEAGSAGLIYYRLKFGHWSLSDANVTKVEAADTREFLSRGEAGCEPFSQCLDYIESLQQHWGSSDEMKRFDAQVQFQQLLRFILWQNLSSSKEQSSRKAVELSISHMKEHYQQLWSVDQLADLANVARWQYTRIFKEITGQIPLEYLNDIRIERAKQLLLTTEDRLYYIADHVGFNNEYYFNRRFKQTVGVSPGQYRRSHKENMRVFAPFLEDFLVVLGVTPVMQCSHASWGTQDYLGLKDVPVLDISEEGTDLLSRYRPDFIIMDRGLERWITEEQLEKLAPTHSFLHPGEDWRATLRQTAHLVGRTGQVQEIVAQYERKVGEARNMLRRSIGNQTVACLRITAQGIYLCAGPEYGYTGPVLYKDLGLSPHPLVRQLASKIYRVALDPESLQKLDADHLFITFDKQNSVLEGEERHLLTSPLWQSLRAVKNRCVYEVDFFSWMNYGILSHNRKIDDVLQVLA